MKQTDLLAVIPTALAELRDAGRTSVYFEEIGRQVTLHDEIYLQRRNMVRRVLGRVGINIAEEPSGFLHPGPGKMYPALAKLETQGIIVGDFEGLREDDKPSRIMYQLAESAIETKV